MKNSLLIILIHVFAFGKAQLLLQGIVKDADTGELLTFVNIGIKNKNVGTLASDQGQFSIAIPALNMNDSLSFSLAGYQLTSVFIPDLIKSSTITISLNKKTNSLDEVVVTGKKFAEKKYGIAKTKPALRIIDASIQQTDIFEIAQLVHLGNKPSKVTSIHLLVNESRIDSGVFRINFYKYDGSKPTEPLLDKSILETLAVKEGWLTVDLKKYNVFLKGDVVAAIEFLPSKKLTAPIRYEVKLGGTSRSFLRTSSLGSWNTPPHHYRVYIKILEDTETSENQDDEKEEETQSTKKLYSTFVQDTFSLFVHLPKNYQSSRKKKYPVIFMLDANVYSDILTQSIERLTSDEKTKEAIIIGIGYRDFLNGDSLRDRDYTYPAALARDSFRVSGGALRFLNFIEKELNPYLTKTYRIDTNQRTLMGHSLGGYFTLLALLQNQQYKRIFFKNYISASPSLDYADFYLLSEFKNLSAFDSSQVNLFLSIGALETEDFKSFDDLLKLLSRDKFKTLRVNTLKISGADHMGAAVPAFEKGLELFLRPSVK